jgi:hypothetical protein
MRKLTRMEANKEVRRVLNKFHVDLTQCSYSVGGREIRLSGFLRRIDSTEFMTMHIEGMIQEFMRRMPSYHINGEFENWRFTTEHITNLKKDDDKKNLGLDLEEDYGSEAS